MDDISSCSTVKNNLSSSWLSPAACGSQLSCSSSSPSGSSTSAKLPTVHYSASLKSTSSKSSHDKENMYMKRGSAKKRKGSLVEEALGAIKTLSSQPTSENDSAEYFGVCSSKITGNESSES